jgi:hypothetical protein
VRLGGVILVGLGFEEANDLVRLLNGQEREIQREARQLVLVAVPRGAPQHATPRVREAAHARPY